MVAATKDVKKDVEEGTVADSYNDERRPQKKLSGVLAAVAAFVVTAIAIAFVVGALKLSNKKGDNGGGITNNDSLASSNSGMSEPGTDPLEVCACSPTSYELKLNFTNTCDTSPELREEEGQNMGISSFSCLVDAFGDASATDFVPVSVQSIDILELGQEMTVLSQRTIDGDDFDETSNGLVYNSIITDEQFRQEESDLPSAIQFSIVGRNQFDKPLINVFIITFTNDCSAQRTLESGLQVGWVTIVSTVCRNRQVSNTFTSPKLSNVVTLCYFPKNSVRFRYRAMWNHRWETFVPYNSSIRI